MISQIHLHNKNVKFIISLGRFVRYNLAVDQKWIGLKCTKYTNISTMRERYEECRLTK